MIQYISSSHSQRSTCSISYILVLAFCFNKEARATATMKTTTKTSLEKTSLVLTARFMIITGRSALSELEEDLYRKKERQLHTLEAKAIARPTWGARGSHLYVGRAIALPKFVLRSNAFLCRPQHNKVKFL